jgi:hypothetical protein
VLTAAGRESHARLVAAGRSRLVDVLAGWDPDEHAELRPLLDRLTQAVVSEMPVPRASSSTGPTRSSI